MLEFIRDNIFKFLLLLVTLLLITLIIVQVFDFKLLKRNTEEFVEEIAIKDEGTEFVEDLIEEEIKQVTVDIKGAVKKPGVYVLNEGSIVNDVIELAGGFSKGGTAKNINLSKKVQDEMVIYIYTSYQLSKMNDENKVSDDCKTNNVDITSCDGASIIVSGDEVVSTSSTSDKVSLNNGTKEQLMSVTGIGEAKALAIIEYREKNGGFKSIEELMNVSGIGESIFNKVKDYFKL